MQVKLQHDMPCAAEQLAEFISQFINLDTIIVCIGTDKRKEDSLGPIVGTLLYQEKYPLKVYGKLGNTVNALNVADVIEEIYQKHPNSNILAIDAGCGENIGDISARDYPISPGAALGKELPKVGVASIVGTTLNEHTIRYIITNERGSLEGSMLYRMASVIVKTLQISYEKAKERN